MLPQRHHPETSVAHSTWQSGGTLSNARDAHTATLLPNGLVLVAGGELNFRPIASAELYNPSTGSWTATGSLITARVGHTATLLGQKGWVLVAGGAGSSGVLSSAETYDPATGVWGTSASLVSAREFHTATYLPIGGLVLVAGGSEGVSVPYLSSAEIRSPGLGYTPATQPQLNPVSAITSTSGLSLTGSNFTGVSEASGGTTQNSASNLPVVRLQSLVNDQVVILPLNPASGFTSTSFNSLPLTGFVPGYALLTMFVNGTPSTPQIVPYSEAGQSLSNFPATQTLTLGQSPYALPSQTMAGLALTYVVLSGPATVTGDTLTLTGTGTVVLQAYQAGNGTYAPLADDSVVTVTASSSPPVATDTPLLPGWGLAALGLLLLLIAGRTVAPRSNT